MLRINEHETTLLAMEKQTKTSSNHIKKKRAVMNLKKV